MVYNRFSETVRLEKEKDDIKRYLRNQGFNQLGRQQNREISNTLRPADNDSGAKTISLDTDTLSYLISVNDLTMYENASTICVYNEKYGYEYKMLKADTKKHIRNKTKMLLKKEKQMFSDIYNKIKNGLTTNLKIGSTRIGSNNINSHSTYIVPNYPDTGPTDCSLGLSPAMTTVFYPLSRTPRSDTGSSFLSSDEFTMDSPETDSQTTVTSTNVIKLLQLSKNISN